MKSQQTISLGALIVVSTTIGLFASQEPQPPQDRQEQQEHVEQTPPRAAGTAPTTYPVRMAAEPVGTYRGTNARFRGTARARGEKLNAADPAVATYAAYLDGTHDAALQSVGGGRKLYDYRYVVNGFSALLTPGQAAQLARTPGVVSVEPDGAAPLATITTPAFLGLTAEGGLWEQLGGVRHAGEGIIIGMVDSGVWPEHPSFSDRTRPGPHDMGGNLSYRAIPGWHGKCTPGEAFNASHCNNKLIAAHLVRSAKCGGVRGGCTDVGSVHWSTQHHAPSTKH